jgi:hypothetical protein
MPPTVHLVESCDNIPANESANFITADDLNKTYSFRGCYLNDTDYLTRATFDPNHEFSQANLVLKLDILISHS